MEPKRVDESSISISYLMLPQDANPAGHIHGGVILKHIDTTGGVVAMRHARCNAVTASIDRVDFIKPVNIGELVHFKASINMVGRTSMEIGVRVEGENLFTGEIRHCATAYLTYVALDAEGRPRPTPSLLVETDEEKRRYNEAISRRRLRLAQKSLEGPARS
jgi:uncharacterized protein (TIGR00369 family)